MRPEPKTVELPNGVTLPYAEQGEPSEISVLLLHGFADSWRSFQLVLALLPESIHALALTQRGHGDASLPPTGYGVTDFASDLAEFVDAVHLRKAIVVGHSMGSGVALRFAIDHPELTIGLVLVGAAPSLRGTEEARKFWESTVSKLTDPVDPEFVRQMTQGRLAKPVPSEFLDAAALESMKVPAFVWREAVETRWRLHGDYEAELGKIEVPTLIVWGDQDARYSRREQETLASAIAGSRLVVYEGAGHMLHWEEPERFAADLVAFVEGIVR